MGEDGTKLVDAPPKESLDMALNELSAAVNNLESKVFIYENKKENLKDGVVPSNQGKYRMMLSMISELTRRIRKVTTELV